MAKDDSRAGDLKSLQGGHQTLAGCGKTTKLLN